MTSVYVAASSHDLDRAKRWTRSLLDCGIRVSSTWVDVIEALGEANPVNATATTRAGIASLCLEEVTKADVTWLLLPPPDMSTAGAWVEFGVAYACGRLVISSGKIGGSVFSALGAEFECDAFAFAEILRLDEAEEFGPRDAEPVG